MTRAAGSKIDFNFQVRPMLASHCLKCHGMDAKSRKGKLRLDDRDAAVAKKAIVPGDTNASGVIQRILSTNPDEVMPPPESHDNLSPQETEILKQWIVQGAEYQKHWAFIPPVKPAVPKVEEAKSLSPIDAFVRETLVDKGIQPAPEVSREKWLRRVTLDLTGLPPTTAEIDAFLGDTSQKAHEAVVDRLLKSTAYGEHMATSWLDAARYADTYGRHEDAECSVWPYRDWVVRAFNQNLPYHQFLIWQTAGDLLPHPTTDQLVATAFNRLVQQSNEAGSNEEEFRQEHVADRVRTNATAILGLTLECARCHDHKYDPLTMRDYYSLSAFLNNIDELGLYARQTAGVPAPSVLLFSPEQQKQFDELHRQIRSAEDSMRRAREEGRQRFNEFLARQGRPRPAEPIGFWDFNRESRKKKTQKEFINRITPSSPPALARQTPEIVAGKHDEAVFMQGDYPITVPLDGAEFHRYDPFSFSIWFKPGEEQERAVLVHRSRGGLDAASRGYELILNQMQPEFSISHFAPGNSIRIRAKQKIKVGNWTHLAVTYDGSSRAAGMRIYVNGSPAEVAVVSDHLYKDCTYRKQWGDFDESKLQDNGTPTVDLLIGWRYNDMGAKNATFDDFKMFDRELSPIEVCLLEGGADGDDPQVWLDAYLRDHDGAYQEAAKQLRDLRHAEDDLVSSAGEIMVMAEMQPRRPTYILKRGNWDQKGDPVQPATPEGILPMPPEFPRNRLGLAQWYVDRRNPLTARVFVNRVWQNFFGTGIVATSEDFGTQGEAPSHPQLLDWLACEFMDRGWDVKWLCREIALSATYRQRSVPADKQLLAEDPQNRLLARGPRCRLSAEQVRDLALAVSGLLVPTAGGAPVKPYQPASLYEESGVQAHYVQDHGEALWRRSLYSLKKRTLPLPNMTVFDAPTREFCKARRDHTNTPLQALTLLNDPQFVEACRVLAEQEMQQHPSDERSQLLDSFRRFTGRAANDPELQALHAMLEEERTYFRSHEDEAQALLAHNGEHPVITTLPAADVAALTIIERVLLSDDETIIKQ